MLDNLLKSHAFKLKGRFYTLTVLQLACVDRQAFEHQLDEMIGKAPRLFENTPVVLDLTPVANQDVDLNIFCTALRTRLVFPAAVQTKDPALAAQAQSMGLAVLNASALHDKPLKKEPKKTTEIARTKLLTTPVRSGQQVVSKGGDLVITSSVSHGAELLADGNIHVYGVLRGRALAGISGDLEARIFCHALEAELVSIAGYYRLSDAITPLTGPCQIYLQDEHICIEPL